MQELLRTGIYFCKLEVNLPIHPYLRHEFEQAKKKNKKIIILYNSFYKQESWLPFYMKGYEKCAHPFWKRSLVGNKVGDYEYIKNQLEF